jgi:hypothetical protein
VKYHVPFSNSLFYFSLLQFSSNTFPSLSQLTKLEIIQQKSQSMKQRPGISFISCVDGRYFRICMHGRGPIPFASLPSNTFDANLDSGDAKRMLKHDIKESLEGLESMSGLWGEGRDGEAHIPSWEGGREICSQPKLELVLHNR